MCTKMLETIRKAGILPLALTVLIGFLPASAGARSEQQISSDLLLPHFQVDLETGNLTTLLTVGNAAEEDIEITIEVFTNWGVPVLEVPLTLDPGAVQPLNLLPWLRDGVLPGETLSAEDLAHLQAALTGPPTASTTRPRWSPIWPSAT